MAQKFWYPEWRKKVEELKDYHRLHLLDMIQLNGISGTELDQLDALDNDLDTIVKNPLFPKYRMDR